MKNANCDTHGPYIARPLNTAGQTGNVTKCPKCCANWLKQCSIAGGLLSDESLSTEDIESAFDKTLSARFSNVTLENYQVDPNNQDQAFTLDVCKSYADNFEKHCKSGAGLILTGTPGTGKTHLAIAIGRAVAKQGNSVEYVSLADIIREIRETWTDNKKSESKALARFQNCKLLIIDEVGIQAGSENEKNIIFQIIDARYQRADPTFAISNLNVEEMVTYIGERSIDRLLDGGGTLVFNWESNRNRGAA